MFNRAAPVFVAFDLLYIDGRDLRDEPLLRSKRQLEAVLQPDKWLMYVQHINGHGVELFQTMCEMDAEGIVAKPKISPYREVGRRSTWLKIKNPDYSQAEGRGELFNQ